MLFGRPGSHIAAICYFLLMSVAFAFTGYRLYVAGDAQYVGQFALALPHVIALASLATRSRWSYYFCAALVFAFPAFLIGSLLVILIKVQDAKFASLVPSFIGSVLLLFLFYRYTFGEPSRSFYSFNKSNVAAKA
jgi:hypothetical protein